jgi:hypothetical protein
MKWFIVAAFLFGSITSSMAENGGGSFRNYSPSNIIRVACDQSSARTCQQQATGCQNLCDASNNPASCRSGCMDRYKNCKVNAGCGDY